MARSPSKNVWLDLHRDWSQNKVYIGIPKSTGSSFFPETWGAIGVPGTSGCGASGRDSILESKLGWVSEASGGGLPWKFGDLYVENVGLASLDLSHMRMLRASQTRRIDQSTHEHGDIDDKEETRLSKKLALKLQESGFQLEIWRSNQDHIISTTSPTSSAPTLLRPHKLETGAWRVAKQMCHEVLVDSASVLCFSLFEFWIPSFVELSTFEIIYIHHDLQYSLFEAQRVFKTPLNWKF